METSSKVNAGLRIALLSCGLMVSFARAQESSGANAEGAAPPKENFLTSLKQAFKQDFDHEVVRGHFDVGTAPDAHRYYCLVDAKTGKREPSGVSGQTELRKDGMTGMKPGAAVALYSCDSAEEQGMLVTTGYILTGGAAAGAMAAKPRVAKVPATVPAVAPTPEPEAASPLSTATVSDPAAKVDVAGIRLGMSADDVRVVLKSKKLLEWHESWLTLGEGGKRYVTLIAAWTAETSGAETAKTGESIQVMFTPVPGRERAMAIVRTLVYAPPYSVREPVLDAALSQKYGAGHAAAGSTWRIQSDGSVQTGDACQRRKLFGGLAELTDVAPQRANIALKTTPDEFRQQVEQCGVAIVTEDHAAAAAGGRDERVVSRMTVSAYSPSIAFEGSTSAAQLLQSAPKSPVRTVTGLPSL